MVDGGAEGDLLGGRRGWWLGELGGAWAAWLCLAVLRFL